jgi:hypothetical protein
VSLSKNLICCYTAVIVPSCCVVDADVNVNVDSDVDVAVDVDDVDDGCRTAFVLDLLYFGNCKDLLAAALPNGFVESTAETSLLDADPCTNS